MPKALKIGETYAGRRQDITVMVLSLDREAATLLKEYAGGGRVVGRFISRLIFEHRARLEERLHMRRQVAAVLDDPEEVSHATD